MSKTCPVWLKFFAILAMPLGAAFPLLGGAILAGWFVGETLYQVFRLVTFMIKATWRWVKVFRLHKFVRMVLSPFYSWDAPPFLVAVLKNEKFSQRGRLRNSGIDLQEQKRRPYQLDDHFHAYYTRTPLSHLNERNPIPRYRFALWPDSIRTDQHILAILMSLTLIVNVNWNWWKCGLGALVIFLFVAYLIPMVIYSYLGGGVLPSVWGNETAAFSVYRGFTFKAVNPGLKLHLLTPRIRRYFPARDQAYEAFVRKAIRYVFLGPKELHRWLPGFSKWIFLFMGPVISGGMILLGALPLLFLMVKIGAIHAGEIRAFACASCVWLGYSVWHLLRHRKYFMYWCYYGRGHARFHPVEFLEHIDFPHEDERAFFNTIYPHMISIINAIVTGVFLTCATLLHDAMLEYEKQYSDLSIFYHAILNTTKTVAAFVPHCCDSFLLFVQ